MDAADSFRVVSEPSRLDQALTRLFPELSRRLARIAILEGRVRLNGKTAKIIAREVRVGDKLAVQAVAAGAPPSLSSETAAAPVEVLFSDQELVVVHKPAHVLSERVPQEKGRAIADLLADRFGALSLVHRLDAGTSGVMMLARTARATEVLSEAFRSKRVRKVYLLLCVGLPGNGRFDQPLGRDPAHPRKMAVREDGKTSATSYVQLASAGDIALVAAYPETGRTHQIRVHFAHAGFPLLGDVIYGGPSKRNQVLFKRALLHAYHLAFAHPKTQAALRFTSPPPADFQWAVDKLLSRTAYDEVLSRSDQWLAFPAIPV